jgi:HD superfamily phosphohydrolase
MVRKSHSSININDSLNVSQELPDYIMDLIATPEVQRLTEIKQLGFAYIVYPNATHTRFPHCVGTAKGAISICDYMQENGPEKLGDFKKVVASAALLHDLKHPPYSHGLEPLIEHYTGESHEESAAKTIRGEISLREAYESFPKGVIPDNSLQNTLEVLSEMPTIPEVLLQHGISPKDVANTIFPTTTDDNHFIREIISHCIFDADRGDYIPRDIMMCGIKEASADKKRLTGKLGVVDTEDGLHMALERGAVLSFNNFLQARMTMFTEVYHHPVSMEAEAMMNEGFKRFFRTLPNPEQYVKAMPFLTDTQFNAFFDAQCSNPVAAYLVNVVRWDKKNIFKMAEEVESRYMGYTKDGDSKRLDILKHVQSLGGDFPEEVMATEILDRANAGKSDKLQNHEVIVYQRSQKGLKTNDEFRQNFDFWLYDKRDGTSLHSLDALATGDTHVGLLYQTFISHQLPHYLIVIGPPEHNKRIEKATQEYLNEVL